MMTYSLGLQSFHTEEKTRSTLSNIPTKNRMGKTRMTTLHGNTMTTAISRTKKILAMYHRMTCLIRCPAGRLKTNLDPPFNSPVRYASLYRGPSVARPVVTFSVFRALPYPVVCCTYEQRIMVYLDAFARCIVNRVRVLYVTRQEKQHNSGEYTFLYNEDMQFTLIVKLWTSKGHLQCFQ